MLPSINTVNSFLKSDVHACIHKEKYISLCIYVLYTLLCVLCLDLKTVFFKLARMSETKQLKNSPRPSQV